MKNLKKSIATFWIAIVSFFSKVKGQRFGVEDIQDAYWPAPIQVQALYWVPSPEYTALKLAKWPLIAIAFIIWIISLIKIRKIEDKTQKKKKIKRTIITISILVILIVACFVLPLLLKKY